MIHLEKISTARSKTYNTLEYAFSDAMDHPGLIGIFYNNPEFGDVIKRQCKEQGLAFGERFGAKGISADLMVEIISEELQDTDQLVITKYEFATSEIPQKDDE